MRQPSLHFLRSSYLGLSRFNLDFLPICKIAITWMHPTPGIVILRPCEMSLGFQILSLTPRSDRAVFSSLGKNRQVSIVTLHYGHGLTWTLWTMDSCPLWSTLACNRPGEKLYNVFVRI